MKLITFELGKCYQHKSGKQIYVCGHANTILYGWVLVSEVGGHIKPSEALQPVGNDSDSTVGWEEISIEQFKTKNYEKEGK